MRYLPYPLILLLAAALFACGKAEPESSLVTKGEVIPVKVLDLQQANFSTHVTASGTFSTKDETLLSFKVGGIVSQVLVQEGDPVKKGQILATLDLTEIQAGLNQAKFAFEKALRDHDRARRLYEDSVATLEQYQNTKTALDIAEQQVRTAEFNISYSQIRATQNGFVLRKFVNSGQLVTSGAPVLQINGATQGNWILQATVNDQNWSGISIGDRALIQAADSDSIPGRVIRKSQVADPMTGAYWIEVAPDQMINLNLASGMYGKTVISPIREKAGWEIPYEAILDAAGSAAFVFVTTDGVTARKIQVQLGKIGENTVQVLSGLENQGRLIVSGSAYLTDGSTIQIQD